MEVETPYLNLAPPTSYQSVIKSVEGSLSSPAEYLQVSRDWLNHCFSAR